MARMATILQSMDKMHKGLVSLIQAHNDLAKDLDERIKKLEALEANRLAAKKDK